MTSLDYDFRNRNGGPQGLGVRQDVFRPVPDQTPRTGPRTDDRDTTSPRNEVHVPQDPLILQTGSLRKFVYTGRV